MYIYLFIYLFINSFVFAVSLNVAEKLKTLTKYHELPLFIMPFDIVAYGFVGQPFSKQLYKTFSSSHSQVLVHNISNGNVLLHAQLLTSKLGTSALTCY